jgi:hypothetical protein
MIPFIDPRGPWTGADSTHPLELPIEALNIYNVRKIFTMNDKRVA